MTNGFLEILGLILFALLLISLPIEGLLIGLWNRWYFTKGLPLMVLRISVEPHHSNIPSQAQLEAQFRAGWAPSLLFKELDPNQYAFREKGLQLRFGSNTPIMRGLLLFDHDNSQAVVKGFVNWSMVCFFLIGIIASFLTNEPLSIIRSLVIFILFMGMLYSIQLSRFKKVAAFAAQAWSRQHVSGPNTGST